LNAYKSIPGLQLLDGEPVFNEPWEASAFALVVELHQKQAFSWDEWAEHLSIVIANEADDTPYYLSWLKALENILASKSLVEDSEVHRRKSEWQEALEATPHGQSIELQRT
jgi:nitrile hydratase accessory protein